MSTRKTKFISEPPCPLIPTYPTFLDSRYLQIINQTQFENRDRYYNDHFGQPSVAGNASSNYIHEQKKKTFWQLSRDFFLSFEEKNICLSWCQHWRVGGDEKKRKKVSRQKNVSYLFNCYRRWLNLSISPFFTFIYCSLRVMIQLAPSSSWIFFLLYYLFFPLFPHPDRKLSVI